MTTQRDPMLDAEERLLAEQLARIAPRGEPSAELDARILAMAGRGTVHAPSSSARRRPKRWPVWLGVAASLTAVAGLVWRLEPILHPGQPVRYEAPAPVAADTDPNGQRSPVAYVATQVAADAVPPPAPPMMSAPLPGAAQKPASPAAKSMAEVAMKPAVDAASDETGWAHLGPVGSYIAKQSSEFDSRTYGYAKLGELFRAIGLFEIEERKTGDGPAMSVFVRDLRKSRG